MAEGNRGKPHEPFSDAENRYLAENWNDITRTKWEICEELGRMPDECNKQARRLGLWRDRSAAMKAHNARRRAEPDWPELHRGAEDNPDLVFEILVGEQRFGPRPHPRREGA